MFVTATPLRFQNPLKKYHFNRENLPKQGNCVGSSPFYLRFYVQLTKKTAPFLFSFYKVFVVWDNGFVL